MTKKLSLAELKAKANAVTSATALNAIKGGTIAGGPLSAPTTSGGTVPVGTLNPGGCGCPEPTVPTSAPTTSGGTIPRP